MDTLRRDEPSPPLCAPERKSGLKEPPATATAADADADEIGMGGREEARPADACAVGVDDMADTVDDRLERFDGTDACHDVKLLLLVLVVVLVVGGGGGGGDG